MVVYEIHAVPAIPAGCFVIIRRRQYTCTHWSGSRTKWRPVTHDIAASLLKHIRAGEIVRVSEGLVVEEGL